MVKVQVKIVPAKRVVETKSFDEDKVDLIIRTNILKCDKRKLFYFILPCNHCIMDYIQKNIKF